MNYKEIIRKAREWCAQPSLYNPSMVQGYDLAHGLLTYLETLSPESKEDTGGVSVEVIAKAVDMARESSEGIEITISPEMKYTKQQILEKLTGETHV